MIRRKMLFACIATVMFVGLTGSSIILGEEKEEKISLDKLPKAAIDNLKKRFPKGELKEATVEKEKGKTSYEVVVMVGSVKYEVSLTGTGEIEEFEKVISVQTLPKAVLEAVTKKYVGCKIKDASELTVVKNGKETDMGFELEIIPANSMKGIEIIVSAQGKITEKKD